MSLFSILNSTDSSTYSSSTSAQITQALQTIASSQSTTTSSTTTSASSSVLITTQAKREANAKADALKEPETLVADLRADLDAQYEAAGKKNSADLTTLSARALATIALNDSGSFSRAEVDAAKLELRTRDRQSALSTLGSGPLTLSTLKTYTQDLLTARASMSEEEQKLRASNPNVR